MARALRQPAAARRETGAPPPAQAGFSLIEVLIAIVVLAVMTVGLIPLLIGSAKASTVNSTLVAATTYGNAKLEAVRSQFPNDGESSCTTVAGVHETGAVDPAGTGLKADLTVSSCPTSLPGTVTVAVTVYRSGSTVSLVTLKTEILVTAA